MSSANTGRSVATMRIPVERVRVTLVLDDGKDAEATVFLRFGEDLTHFLTGDGLFLPVLRDDRVCFIARSAIACVGIPLRGPRAHEDELPMEQQQATIELTSGVRLHGKLRWPSSFGRERTVDHLNEHTSFVELHMATATYFVAKSKIVLVEEQ